MPDKPSERRAEISPTGKEAKSIWKRCLGFILEKIQNIKNAWEKQQACTQQQQQQKRPSQVLFSHISNAEDVLIG